MPHSGQHTNSADAPLTASQQQRVVDRTRTCALQAAALYQRQFSFIPIRFDLSGVAVGQILEYAYHLNRQYTLLVRMVIVGRRPLTDSNIDYLEYLTTKFGLPLSYRVVELRRR